MKTLETLARTLAVAVAVAIGAAATLASPPVAARTVGVGPIGAAGWHGGAGPYHYRGGYWGHRGYWPGAFWGGVGIGLGVGAIGYYGAYYAPYYGGYYAPYYGGYYSEPYYDPPLAVAPVYGSADSAPARTGQPVPQQRAVDPIFYPKNGQSAETIEADRRDCNRWATTQPGAMADASIFQRATFACMEGRSYTVR